MQTEKTLKIIYDAFDKHYLSDYTDLLSGEYHDALAKRNKFMADITEKFKSLEPPFDYTFPTRLKGFIEGVTPNCAMGQEEQEYIERAADKLLKYQIETARDPYEVSYLNRLHKEG